MFVHDCHEQCGVVAVTDISGQQRNVAPITVKGAEGVQHRGLQGYGLASKLSDVKDRTRGNLLDIVRGNGCVKSGLCNVACGNACAGASAIGHTRYTTCGSDDPENSQPFHFRENGNEYAFAFNGNLANYPELREGLQKAGIELQQNVDTEVIRQIMIDTRKRAALHDVFDTLATVQRKIDGSCNIVMLDEDGSITGYRDKRGFRPLAATVHDGFVAIASEDSALKRMWRNAETFDIEPGQAIHVDAKTLKMQLMKIADPELSRCFFEWIYFSNFMTNIDGVSVAEARFHIGCLLAQSEDVEFPKDTIVVPVPKSAKLAAFGFANAKGLKYEEGISINEDENGEEYGRTFIESNGRHEKAKKKYRLEEVLRGKHIVLVEDSMVRGTTMDRLVGRLWQEVSPQSIHVRLACPPILNICPYGINISTKQELIARKVSNYALKNGNLSIPMMQELARMIDVQTLRYASLPDVTKALHFPESELCLACVNGTYPTPFGVKRNEEAR